MSDHTRQSLGRTHGHTCSTLVGTPELAQPARALAPASGQVRRAPTPSAVPARAYKASPGAPLFAPHSPSSASHRSLALAAMAGGNTLAGAKERWLAGEGECGAKRGALGEAL